MLHKTAIISALLCLFSTFNHASPASTEATAGECYYIPAKHPEVDSSYYHQLIDRSYEEEETFNTILTAITYAKDYCHQFFFKYPLKEAEHAKTFAKILNLKAHEAHRFVPVIKTCRVVAPRHLGFIREISIEKHGPLIQEHVLIDNDSASVIFIEDWSIVNGTWNRGSFAALNRVEEIEGIWYFTGNYLYLEKPSEDTVEERIAMFNQTYENMLKFIEDENAP